MKLTELINGVNELFTLKTVVKTSDDDFTLYPKHLFLIKNQLQSCDEFKDCELEILSVPNITTSSGSTHNISSESLAITPGTKFKRKAYIFSMWLTPEMYDPSVFLKKMEKDGGITPVIYNPNDFTPEKFIILKVNPNELNVSDKSANHYLHSTLDKILNNPTEYQIKGDRHVVIRGIFESIEFQSGKGRNHLIDDKLLEKYVMK